MAAFALGKRKGDFAVAYTALLPKQICRHADLIGTFLRNENGGVAVRADQPQRVLSVRKEFVRHGTLGHTNDVHNQDCRFGIGIVDIPNRLDPAIVHRTHPIYSIA